MSNKKTIGERVDKVVDKVSDKVEKGKDRIATVKEDVADIAHDISKSVKKAVADSGDAVSDLIHEKKSSPARHSHKKEVGKKKAS